MSDRAGAPGFARRAAALAAIVLVVVVVAITVVRIADDLRRLAFQAPVLAVAVGAAWFALTRTGGRRRLAGAVCVVAIVAFLAFAFVEGWEAFALAFGPLVMLAAAAWLGRYALGRDTRTMRVTPTSGVSVGPANQPVVGTSARARTSGTSSSISAAR